MKNLVFALFAFGFFCAAQASVESHEHGSAELKLTRDSRAWKVELEIPMVSLVGFEECAQSSDQKRKVQSISDRSGHAQALFTWSSESQCQARSFSRESEILNKPCNLPEGHHDSLIVKFELQCQNPEKLKNLALKDKGFFKDVLRIKYQATSNSQTFTGEMSPLQNQINLQ